MSIIADTLKRLQIRTTTTTPELPGGSSLRPTFNQGEGTGRHLKDSRIKFWVIRLGLTLGLGGLALSAYWIGWHLDFDFSANTHARLANSRPAPTTPVPLNVQNTPPQPSETVESNTPEPILLSILSSQINEQPSSPTTMAAIGSSANQQSSPAPPSVHPQPVVALSERPVTSKSSDQQIQSASEESTENDSAPITPKELHPEESETLVESVQESDSEEENPTIVGIEIEETEGPQHTKPEVGTLGEENVPTEEFVQSAKLSTKPTHTPPTFAARKKFLGEPNPKGIPRQPSPASRLRHAQQLIQSGEYEDAVALLSPLFHDPPVKWHPWFWMGTALLGKGDMEQADQFFLSGLARDDKVPQLWIQRALVAQERGHYQLAIHELRQAESLQADLPHIHLNMAMPMNGWAMTAWLINIMRNS